MHHITLQTDRLHLLTIITALWLQGGACIVHHITLQTDEPRLLTIARLSRELMRSASRCTCSMVDGIMPFMS